MLRVFIFHVDVDIPSINIIIVDRYTAYIMMVVDVGDLVRTEKSNNAILATLFKVFDTTWHIGYIESNSAYLKILSIARDLHRNSQKMCSCG